MSKNKEHTTPAPHDKSVARKTLYLKESGWGECIYFLPHPTPLPFLSPLRQPYQSITEQNMKPEVEMEMNGEVTDQAPQLIHCPLDTQVKRGPAFLV